MRLRTRTKVIIGVALVLALLPVGLVFGANRYVNDHDVPLADDLWVEGAPKKALVVWAHPDDEIGVAGTVKAMSLAPDAEITMVYFTRGEAAKDTGYQPDELARIRTDEVKAAGRLLGANNVEVLSYPDSGLPAVSRAEVLTVLDRLVDKYQPSVVISFDDKVGYYGHPDHITVGRWVKAALTEGSRKPSVKAYYQATFPQPMIDLALKMSTAFRDHYPKDPAQGLPAATVAVPISDHWKAKRELLDVHRSQAKVVADVQPYYDKVPGWVYYNIFSKEYYARVEL